MTALAHQRCFNHARREAVARCPGCERYFCRECVTEHADRVLCASCLKKQAVAATVRPSRWSALARLAAGAAGLLLVWVFFYFAGRILLLLPSDFHEGTMWRASDDAEK
ncbi:MAG: rhomboid family protein [Verrucomicrobiae bacterium]|nr:rhomboid family protein [Verrucomicrobiae bacterium]